VYILREERRLRVFLNRALKKIFEFKREEVQYLVTGENCIMRGFMICVCHMLLFDDQIMR
jgi:hypothetical protein